MCEGRINVWFEISEFELLSYIEVLNYLKISLVLVIGYGGYTQTPPGGRDKYIEPEFVKVNISYY